jgi:hypothetical protein
VLHEILIFFVACFSSAVLIQAFNVNTRVGNGRGQSDLFPSTHWSVVLEAGRSQPEPEIAQAALSFADTTPITLPRSSCDGWKPPF